MSTTPRIAVHGEQREGLLQASRDGGGEVVGVTEDPDAIVLDHINEQPALRSVLDAAPHVRWVQLPSAGIDAYREALTAHPDLAFTSAKGAYASPVAEHALALTLAVARGLKQRARATSWGEHAGVRIDGLHAVVVGAGGVGLRIMELLQAFGLEVDVVRRTDAPVQGAHRTLTQDQLDQVLPEADVVVLAAALTPDSRGLIGAEQLELTKDSAILVNVGRGPLVDTEALLAALDSGKLIGAGLDVTDPEPLPDGHPFWDHERVLITPHVADTLDMIRPLLDARVTRNVAAFAAGEELEGVVDTIAGY